MKQILYLYLIFSITTSKLDQNGNVVQSEEEIQDLIKSIPPQKIQESIANKPVIKMAEEIDQEIIEEKPVLKETILKSQTTKQQRVQEDIKNKLDGPSLKSFKLNEEDTCDRDLISALGMKIPEDRTPFAATTKEKVICRRNLGTCCNHDEIMEIVQPFQEQAQVFRDNMIVLEELSTLFRGEKVLEFFVELRKNEECKLAEDKFETQFTKVENENHLVEFIQMVKDNMFQVLQGIRRYQNHQIQDFANMICTVCNPKESKFFKKSELGNYTAQVNFSNCSEIIDFIEFEFELIRIMKHYLIPLTEFLKCNGEFTDLIKYDVIDTTKYDQQKNLVQSCFDDFGSHNNDCQNICKEKKLISYQFPSNIFKVNRQLLQIWFKILVGFEVEEYYTNVKGMEWEVEVNPVVNFFPEQSETKSEINLNDIEIFFIDQAGISFNNDYMSKLFVETDPKKIL